MNGILQTTKKKRGVLSTFKEPPQTLGGILRDAKQSMDELSRMPGQPFEALYDPNNPIRRDMMSAAMLAPFGITAFHGSPHKFDKFDMNKIGTGEGAQAYGHGLYFAENPQVAGDYARKLAADKNWRAADLVGVDPVTEMYTAIGKGGVKKSFHNQSEALDFAREGAENLYKVDIPDEAVGRMLDWDKPLSQQPEIFKTLIERNIVGSGMGGVTGGEFLNQMGSDPKVTALLKESGIPGIKYLDQGSRPLGGRQGLKVAQQGGGRFGVFDQSGYQVDTPSFGSAAEAQKWLDQGGTSNFVLFDENLAKIMERK